MTVSNESFSFIVCSCTQTSSLMILQRYKSILLQCRQELGIRMKVNLLYENKSLKVKVQVMVKSGKVLKVHGDLLAGSMQFSQDEPTPGNAKTIRKARDPIPYLFHLAVLLFLKNCIGGPSSVIHHPISELTEFHLTKIKLKADQNE